jgi:hypothetical protein
MDAKQIKEKALSEIKEEKFREAVEAEKTRIRKGKWYTNLIPFTIIIKRKR